MRPERSRITRAAWALPPLVALSLSCASTTVPFPWPGAGAPATPGAPAAAPTEAHAEVVTRNPRYRRLESTVLVREVARPTRANLDYAAYHANFMNADPAPEGQAAVSTKRPDVSHAFGGALAPESLTGRIGGTPLTADERAHPLAFAPLVELLASRHIAGADALEEVGSRIRAEDFGLGGSPQITRTTAALLYLHEPGGATPPELWVEVEIAPWFQALRGAPDDDGDGYAQVYGRVSAEALGAAASKTGELARFVHDEYAGRVLAPAEIKGWAHQLASYWYPSYNTDLVTPAGGAWPDAETEPAIRSELGDLRFANPAVVMRGKPNGKPVYDVFLVKGAAGEAGAAGGGRAPEAAPRGPALAATAVSPDPRPVADAVRAELRAHGGSWDKWIAELAPLHAALRRRLKAMPAAVKATAGDDGFLFFRQSMSYVLGGDLAKQRHGKNPLPVIVAFQKMLAARGVDLLFVPVPTKVEIFPDKLVGGADGARAAGQVVNPFERKLLLDLADSGVETIDLLPAFLAERRNADHAATPLYQAQDTHWTTQGLELAARTVAERVKRYPWYAELARHRQRYGVKDAIVTRHGDLHSRLPEADKRRYQPERLVGHQVTAPDGALYDDDAASPVVLLGDSFTGVFQLMDCEHAGVSAHLARAIEYPVDLVMSYGGGPNVRQKLLRRGAGALGTKKLVIWMMTARDLYDFWEGWQPLAPP